VLENFKSYAGVQKIGPFHKSFSSIVGPNGSGKSNVIDGLLFVFGKRAKQLRLSKVSELIHKSQDHKNLDFAKVSVTFQQIVDLSEEDYRVVPNSEFVVTRMAFDNNSSKYYINDRVSNFTDVTNLLKSYGIDLDNNRFLILQGEVEQISLMKPKAPSPHEDGLLEYLEDIIGTNKYVEAIETAAKDIETLNEERTQKLGRVKVVEKEKDVLQGAKAEAENYLLTEHELAQKKVIKAQVLRSQCEQNLQASISKKAELDQRIAEEKSKLSENKTKLESMNAKYQQEKSEYEEIDSQMNEAKNSYEVFVRKDVKIREDIKHLKARKKKLAETIEKESAKVTELTTQREKHVDDMAHLEKEVERLSAAVKKEETALEAVYVSLKGETEQIREKLQKKEKEAAPSLKQLSESQAELDVAQSELKLLIERSSATERALEEAQKQLQAMTSGLEQKRQNAVAQAKGREALTGKLESLKKEMEDLKREEQRLAKMAQEQRMKVEENRSAQQAVTSRGRVLSELMKAKNANTIPGIIGRLGDLGAIDAAYDVAVSTACGALDNIVVQSVADAQRCIEFLRVNNLGRATFISLDKMRPPAPRPNEVPEGVPRLYDLIRVKDERIKPAFYHGLRDTLVANDLEQASRIAYGKDRRWRVVTLQGQLIETSGTMSGGGGAVSKGGMGSSVVVDTGAASAAIDMQKMETDLQSTLNGLDLCRRQYVETENTFRTLTQQLLSVEKELATSQLDTEALQVKISDVKKHIETLRSSTKLDTADEQRQIEELESTIATKDKAVQKIKRVADAFSQEIKALKDKVMDVGGERLRSQKTLVDNLTKQLDEATSAIQKAKVGITTCDKNGKKATTTVKSSEEELVQVDEKIQKIMAEFKPLEEKAMEVQAKYEQAKLLLQGKEQQLLQHKTEYDEFAKSIESLRSKEVDLLDQLKDLGRDVQQQQAHVSHYTKEILTVIKEQAEQFDGSLLDEEIQPVAEIPQEELSQYRRDELETEVNELAEQLKALKPNTEVITEYRRLEADYTSRSAELAEITMRRDDARAMHDSLRKRRLEEFMLAFSIITMKLKEMYQMITLGGDAELELVDSLDPFSEGIVFSVRPPKKSWKNISNLSGGEKTLSSLALVFALHHYKPTPLYFMDEIDAALDFKNVSIVANYIKERTKDAQFIIISLRNNMFELADRLVGIYKTHNCTKTVTINPNMFSMAPAPTILGN